MPDDWVAYMIDCEGVIRNEIAQGCTRRQVARSYALAIRTNAAKVEAVDWKAINAAIVARWSPSGLEWIKKQAWSGECFESAAP